MLTYLLQFCYFIRCITFFIVLVSYNFYLMYNDISFHIVSPVCFSPDQVMKRTCGVTIKGFDSWMTVIFYYFYLFNSCYTIITNLYSFTLTACLFYWRVNRKTGVTIKIQEKISLITNSKRDLVTLYIARFIPHRVKLWSDYLGEKIIESKDNCIKYISI